jgi:uncharacterized protein (TIGR02147 family)
MTISESSLQPYHLEVLHSVFAQRKAKNPRYSLRSYAASFNMNPGTLSSILKGRRDIPADSVQDVLASLKLSREDENKFVASVAPQAAVVTNSLLLNPQQHAKLFEQWEYFVILGLFRLTDFQSSTEWMAQKIQTTEARVQECLQDLLEMGLVSKNESGALSRTQASLQSSHNVSSQAIRNSHRQTLELALRKIESVPPEKRDYSFITVGLDEKRYQRLKKLILKFRDDVFELDESSRKEKLYRVAIQSFPLTSDNT